MLRAAGACVAGPAHMELATECQDALSLRGCKGGWIVAVSDGLGSRAHSARGAKLAVCAAQSEIRALDLRDPSWRAVPAREVASRIYRRWLAAVTFSDKGEAAATLLLAACDAQGYARVWQLGDGLALGLIDGRLVTITPERTGFSNETLALGASRTWSDWQHAELMLRRRGDTLVLMTDGISDDVPPELRQPFSEAIRRQSRSRSRRATRAWLKRELTDWATPGHRDDKTLALIFVG